METKIFEYRINPLEVGPSIAKAQAIVDRINRIGLEGGLSVTTRDVIETDPMTRMTVKKCILTVTSTPIKFAGGWQFVGLVDWLPQGEAIVSAAPSFQNVSLREFATEPTRCDSCNIKQNRNKQIIVCSEAGEFKVVGSTCTKDFLGWVFTPYFFEDAFKDLDAAFGSSDGPVGWQTTQVLALACRVIAARGWVPSGTASSTATIVSLLLSVPTARTEFADVFTKEGISEDEAETLLAKARELAAKAGGDYWKNVAAALTGDFTYRKTLGLVVSVLPTLKRAEIEEARKRLEEEQQALVKNQVTMNELYASEGTKVSLPFPVTVVDEFQFQGAYGTTTVYTFVGNGYAFKWFSSRSLNLSVGDEVTLSGTVKGLDTYNDLTSTLLTRCKVVTS